MDVIVDIVMPTYNPNTLFIDRAIRSIINQSFKQWELYIVQDGGDVKLNEIEKQYTDPRIKYFNIPHQGKAAALNFTIRQGVGKYIAYLDDDDIWYPNHLEVALSTMLEKQIKFLHTDAFEIFLKKVGDQYCEISRNVLNRGVLSDLLLWYVSHINTVHERSLIDMAGPYDESRRMFIDWDMLLRMAKYAKPYHLPVVTCEHYIYLTQEGEKANTISQVHSYEPEYSRKMHDEMFKRAFELLTPDDFVKIVRELYSKTTRLLNTQLENKDTGNQTGDSNNSKQIFRQFRNWFPKIF